MKKKLFFFLSMLLLLASPCFAEETRVTLSLYKDNYFAGETIQLDIVTDDLSEELTAQHVSLQQEGNSISIAPFFTKLEEDHYFVYFDLPMNLQPDNYEVGLTDVLLIEQGVLVEQDFLVNLNLSEGEPVLAIQPGFIQTEQTQYEIDVTSKQGNTALTVTTPPMITHVYTTPVPINQGATRTLHFSLDQSLVTQSSLESITLSYGNNSYVIPVLLHQETTTPVVTPPSTPEKTYTVAFISEVEGINKQIAPGQDLQGLLKFKNTGNQPVDVTFSIRGDLTDMVTLSIAEATLAPGEEQEQYISFEHDASSTEDTLRGELVMTTAYEEKTFPLLFTIDRSATPQQEVLPIIETREPQLDKDDDDLVLPKEIEPFIIEPTKTAKRETNSMGFIIFLILVALGGIIYFYMNKKRVRRQGFGSYVSSVEKK